LAVEVHIGIDDTDSPLGMCTTLVGGIIARGLAGMGVRFSDFPYLVRLNPNIPFKTRGNGAVSLHLKVEEGAVESIKRLVEKTLHAFSESHGKASPTAVVWRGEVLGLRKLYKRALREMVAPSVARALLESGDSEIIAASGGRGLVGAAASIGAYPLDAYTYEAIFYRPVKVRVRERGYAEDLVYDIDRCLRPYVFASVDHIKRRVLATPHGPDPVVIGLRSTNPLVLAALMPRVAQATRAIMAVSFKTNQATGAHLFEAKKVGEARPYDALRIIGRVQARPKVGVGGHVFLRLEDSTGVIPCIVYRNTGALAKVARLLGRGDVVEIGGGVKPSQGRDRPMAVNVEYLRVLKALPRFRAMNPRCPRCGHRMKSAGRHSGMRCERCGFETTSHRKEVALRPPLIQPGVYLPSPIAYRHLSLPREIAGLRPVDVKPEPSLFLYPPAGYQR